jgi:hypothetical protein
LRRLRRWLPIPSFYSQSFVEPLARTVDASFRFSTSYQYQGAAFETIEFQRRLVQQTASKLGYPTEKIPRSAYLNELRSCKVSVSPFGWGDPSWKDFEVIVNGAALLKPDMSHMTTWPDMYLPGETYLPFKWDCSDLESVLDDALSGNSWRPIASRVQDMYRKYLFTREGSEGFCNRVRDIVLYDSMPPVAASRSPQNRKGPMGVNPGDP